MIDLPSIKNLESELSRLYTKQGIKTRSSLFNLVIWSPSEQRRDHLRLLADKITEKFPCRLFFIKQSTEGCPIKLRVSINQKPNNACDFIEMIAAESEIKKLPSLIIPNLVTDLPLFVLWGEDLNKTNDLYTSLHPYATRILYDSTCANSLSAYAKSFPTLTDKKMRDVNWSLLTDWRELFLRTFNTSQKIDKLKSGATIKIEHKGKPSLQARFLKAWLIYKLGLPASSFVLGEKEGEVPEGDIVSIEVITPDHESVVYIRNGRQALVHISTDVACQMPQTYPLLHTLRGFTFWKEVLFEPNSPDYLAMLNNLKQDCTQ